MLFRSSLLAGVALTENNLPRLKDGVIGHEEPKWARVPLRASLPPLWSLSETACSFISKEMMPRFFPCAGLAILSLIPASCSPSLQPFHLPEGFAFKDFVTGQPFDQDSLRGKLLLVNFWAAWSPASTKELPELAALAKEFEPKGLVTVGVCLDDAQASELLVFAERQGVRYPLVWPGEKLLDVISPLETIPYTVLIDNDGKILARFRGPFKPRDVREAVEKNL